MFRPGSVRLYSVNIVLLLDKTEYWTPPRAECSTSYITEFDAARRSALGFRQAAARFAHRRYLTWEKNREA